ncbi:YidC/Oxa1 family membrane protein insertase [Oceanirhabdus sp. W0125-5]|uniref:YidC/Oxa1 family membrane protein insertase n=1 Tax=Oceanirhabdus sp. W0125-5 TaxID=2999116 RepID=UPI0022F31302|nr:YidC/Oxa1 family membrane protein insertase [Oceanirhabdus sp. W0125-5]WBW95801.1 YidC/Oxa1 family membrane protein insertase [Oceanirhabdus sp. W0125-5]
MNIIFEPLRFLLETIFNLTGDWGIAIILLTVIIRVLTMPLSMKQKISMKNQGELNEKINEIKKKYANDKKRLNEEMAKYQNELKESMAGCMGLVIQMPILMAMFSVVKSIPTEIGSVIVPWVDSISAPDKMLIVPIIYVLVLSLPNILCNIKYMKGVLNRTFNGKQAMISIIFGIMITIKAPVALGIYFIIGGISTFVEDVIASIVYKKRNGELRMKN